MHLPRRQAAHDDGHEHQDVDNQDFDDGDGDDNDGHDDDGRHGRDGAVADDDDVGDDDDHSRRGLATQTLVDYCTGAATYNPAITGDQTGTTSQVTTATDAIDCCRKCWLGVNCIGSIFSGANCIQLIITAALDGTPATPMCPLGADDDYIFTPGPGPIYLGPCAAQSQ